MCLSMKAIKGEVLNLLELRTLQGLILKGAIPVVDEAVKVRVQPYDLEKGDVLYCIVQGDSMGSRKRTRINLGSTTMNQPCERDRS